LAFQTQGRVPTRWRFYDFTIFNQMVQKLAVLPPGASKDAYGSTKEREMINWKKIMTMFALIMSPMPDLETIDKYEEQLMQQGGEIINSAEQMAKVPAWFDDFEVIIEDPIAIIMQPAADSDEDEEEAANRNKDFKRLASIKHLLFKIH
jgi:hypothetical protein